MSFKIITLDKLKVLLNHIRADIPDAQIQSDWNQTDVTAVDYIKNKPAGGGSYTAGDGINIDANDEISVDTAFTEASTRANIASGDSLATIWGKIKKFFSDLKTVAFTGSYTDLSNQPTIPTNTNQLTNGAGFITSSGSCASATKATQDADGKDIRQKYVNIYNTNNIGQSSSVTVNDLANQGSSVAMIHAATDNPTGGAKWVHVLSMAWAKGTNTSWVSQLAMGTENNGGLWYRTGSGTIVGRAWKRVIDSDNIASQSVNYATSAGVANTATSAVSATSASSATTASVASVARAVARSNNTNNPMYFWWDGKGGQPSWLWGGSDGTNMYVYNPSNFSVNWATSSGKITAGGVYTICDCIDNAGTLHSTSNNHQFRIQNDCNAVIYSGGSTPVWASGTSSRRFKRNIKSMTEERAKKILNIRPVTFDWIDGQPITTRQCDNAGVIAEEVSKIIPDVVVFEPSMSDPNIKIERRIEYERFTPYLIKLAQMQQKQIDDLTKRIEELEAKA